MSICCYAYNMMGKMPADPAKRHHVDAEQQPLWRYDRAFLQIRSYISMLSDSFIDKAGGPYAIRTMKLIQGVILLAVYLVQVLLETSLSPSYVLLENVKSRSVVM
jgi:hypothetical protein